MTKSCPFGSHRVLDPPNSLPQAAQRLDNHLPLGPSEILVDVDTLNIDSASFHQMMEACGHDPEGLKIRILETVRERGKQHNPVTGSGGMLLGTVREIGSEHPNEFGVRAGDRVATLVSLSLTPLQIYEILEVFAQRDQVRIRGHAFLFSKTNLAVIPPEVPENLALALLDVAGAPAQVLRMVKPGMRVLVIGGGGKSGLLCLAAARKVLGTSGQLLALEPSPFGTARLERTGFCDQLLKLDATDALQVHDSVLQNTEGHLCDVVINCANVANTEMSSIMSCRDDGLVYLFSMATSFTAAALGAEGICSDARMRIGNGFAPDSARISLQILEQNSELRALFEELYA